MTSLRQFPLFDSLSDEQIQNLDQRCHWREFAPGEMIFDHNDTSNDVNFIASGEVRVIVRMIEGREFIFNDYMPGTFFGELSAIDGGQRSANVTALRRSVMCIMPANVFQDIAKKNPDVAWRVMEKMAALIRMLSIRLSEFTFLQAKQRICAELLRSAKPRKGHDGELIISPPPIQRDIADKVSSRREVVSRELKLLERDLIVKKSRGGLIIMRAGELRRRASENAKSSESLSA